MDATTEREILRIRREGVSSGLDILAREVLFTIVVNGVEVVTLSASPHDPNDLTVGFLYAEGVIDSKDGLGEITFSKESSTASVEIEGLPEDRLAGPGERIGDSGCGGVPSVAGKKAAEVKPLPEGPIMEPAEILQIYHAFQNESALFKSTGGVHSAGLARPNGLEIMAEDIARHNAVDRVFGRALLTDLSIEGKMLLTSGRISRGLVLKAARLGVPVVLSRSAPMDLAVEVAEKLNVTVVGFVRGARMNIYSIPERIAGVGRR
jgi:FdhD protein